VYETGASFFIDVYFHYYFMTKYSQITLLSFFNTNIDGFLH